MRLKRIRRVHAGGNPGRPRWLSGLVACAGVLAFVAAVADLAATRPSATALAGLACLLVAGAFAERYPLPLEATGERGVAMTPVFGLTALVLFGWATGTIVFAGATAIALALDPTARRRLGGPAASAAVSGAAAGAAGVVAHRAGAGEALTVCAAAAAYWIARAALPQQTTSPSPALLGLRARAFAAALPSAFCASRPPSSSSSSGSGRRATPSRWPGRSWRSSCTRGRRSARRADAARAHRPAHRPRQPSALPGGAATRTGGPARRPERPLVAPRRHRRLQGGQRPLRSPGRGRGAGRSRRAAARRRRATGSAATSSQC